MSAVLAGELLDDLRLVLTELDRTSRPAARVVAARDRLWALLAPPLFGDGLADPTVNAAGADHGRETERAAALAAMPRTGTNRMRALAAMALAGGDGLTDYELAEQTRIYLYSIAPRRVELLKGGWVRDSGHRRETPNGTPAVVWVLTEAGAARLAHHRKDTASA